MKTTTIKYTCDRCGVVLRLRHSPLRSDNEPRPIRGGSISNVNMWGTWVDEMHVPDSFSIPAWPPSDSLDLCLACGASLIEWFTGKPLPEEKTAMVASATKTNPNRTVKEKIIRPDIKEKRDAERLQAVRDANQRANL